jgi:hypothetical protein
MIGVKNVSVALIAFGALLGLVGAFGTHLAQRGYLQGPGAYLMPLVPSLGAVAFAAIFAFPPLIRRKLRNRFLAERSGAGKKPS